MTTMPLQKQILGFIGWLLLSLCVSALGAIASIQAQSFYAVLTQPSWAPPPWVFGPVWTTLYVMMAISAWLVWRENTAEAKTLRLAQGLYCSQLVVNALWSWLFFAWHLGGVAFADIIVMIALIIATMASFWKIHKLAAALLLPYLFWVLFATGLNFSIWQLNPDLLGL